MFARISSHSLIALFLGTLSCVSSLTSIQGSEILVADRLTNSVYRYSSSGAFIARLFQDNVNLNQPSGIAVSPDLTKLFVTSSQNNQVVRYDYSYSAGTATNPVVFADAADGLMFPNSVLFNQAGNKIYVSNLGGSGVTQFNTDGTSAGAPINGLIAGGSIFQYSGLAFAPGGQLLVGGFQDYPAGTSGSVAKSDAGISSISDFIAPSNRLNGAAGLLVHGNNLYVAGLFGPTLGSGTIDRYNATTGAIDNTFSISGLAFPQSLVAAPEGNQFLASILGFAAGGGEIRAYGYTGGTSALFASASANPLLGFTEATSLLVVPEPGSCVLAGSALAMLVGFAARRRLARKS